jgi:hypothetical protein
MKKLLGGLGGIIVVAGIVIFKMLAPSAEVAATNAMGSGWDGAQAEFMTQITTTLTQEYAAFNLPPDMIQKISKCITDKSVAFLNTTDCSYLYNTATTTEAQHLAAQEQCMAKVQFEKKQEGYTLDCTKESFPDDWKLMHGLFVDEFEKSFAAQGVPADKAKEIGVCISDKLMTLLNTRKCKLINRAATNPEQIFFTLDDCIKDTENDKDFQAVITACAPPAEPPAKTKK